MQAEQKEKIYQNALRKWGIENQENHRLIANGML